MTVTLDKHPAQYDPFRESLAHPMHRDFYDFWRAIAPKQGLPGRHDSTPTDIPRLLPWMVLLDVDGLDIGRRFRIRLMGTGVVQRSGAESTGKWLDEAVSGAQLKSLTAHLGAAVTDGEPVRYVNHSIIEGREHMVIDTLALPLAADGVTVDMLMLLSVEPIT